MENNIIINKDYAILPGAKHTTAFVTGGNADATKPKGVIPKDLTSYPWSPWGDDNLFPQTVLTDLENNSIALRAMEKRKAIHFGRGIICYREGEEDQNTGEKKRVKVEDPEVVDFFKLNQVNRQWVDHIGSLEIFANSWNEFITNKAKDKINRVFFKDPAYCRLAKIDEKSFRIPKLFYSAQWDYCPAVNSGTIVEIPMFDPGKYDGARYQDTNFIYPSFYRSFNKSYYHLAVWNGIRASGWLDIANKVPKLKQAIMKNQMTIKYHIIIPDDYFTKRYPSPQFTIAQQEEKRTEVLQDMNDFLSNVENSGKSWVTYSFYNKIKQEYLSGWEIKVIDNKLKDDAYLPDSQAANSEILFAFGVDPTLLGSGIPGGKLGAGSGSDKREAFWQLNAEMGIYRQISLEPLYFIRDFNKWDPEIQFDYVTVDTSQTMNKNPTKTEKKIDQNAE
jgi:hypothetical protein